MDTTIKIINDKFEFIGSIEKYTSFFFKRNFFQSKEFQLVCSIKYKDWLKDGYILFITPDKPQIIENTNIDETGNILTVKGRNLKSILDRRLIVPPAGAGYDSIKANAEDVIKHYVENSVVNPSDSNRKIEQLVIAPTKNRGQVLNWQSRFKYLNLEIFNICNATGLGWDITLDLKNKRFVFDVIEGKDLTQGISKVIFSCENGNMTDVSETNDSTNWKTMCYVAGQGEDINREIQEVFKTNDTGLSRRELFIDARDIEQGQADKLTDRAKAKLKAYDFANSTTATLLNKNFIYGKDWNLGDIAVRKLNDIVDSKRITEITEVFEDYYKIDAVLGDVIPTPLDQLNQKVDDSNNDAPSSPSEPSGSGSGGSGLIWRPSIDKDGNLSWSLNSSLEPPAPINIKGPKGDTSYILKTLPIGKQNVIVSTNKPPTTEKGQVWIEVNKKGEQ